MSSRCWVSMDAHYRGVHVGISEIDANGKAIKTISVVYTPALAREIANEILIHADKVDALGGPTAELSAICVPGTNVRRGS
jgi:hypothetical protein